MQRKLTVFVLFMLSVTATNAWAAPVQKSADSRSAGDILTPARIESFLKALKADGIDYTRGSMIKPNPVLMACAGKIASCNGNNNTNPYLTAYVPPPGQPAQPGPDSSLTFQIREDEAVVLIGRTPPNIPYFSYRSFVFNRYFEREGTRRKLFASLGDPNNMLTIKTAGASTVYGAAFAIIIASDQATHDRAKAALMLAGYPETMINDDVISPDIAKMSSTHSGAPDPEKDDDFLFLNRFAYYVPDDAKIKTKQDREMDGYLDNPPITVVRLTPNPATEKRKYQPLPAPDVRPHGTGHTELGLLPQIEALRNAIVAAYPNYQVEDIRPTTWLDESLIAFQEDKDVLGESGDTVYLRNEGAFLLHKDEFLMVFGANHAATGKATYSNFTVYQPCQDCAYVGESSMAPDYGAGVSRYLSPNTPNADKLYAWKLARDCKGERHCKRIPTGPCLTGIAPDEKMFVGFRAYVEPSTKISPAFRELAYDRVLKFTPKSVAIKDVVVTPGEAADPNKGVAAGTKVQVQFSLVGGEGDIDWSATLKCDDGCGEAVPTTGKSKAGGKVITNIVVPQSQATLLTLYLNATDAAGRTAHTYGLHLKYIKR
jgi:hypothetical protein